jgi:hypothetical protein
MHHPLLKKIRANRREFDARLKDYNSHVSRLKALNKLEYKIPIPLQLESNIFALKENGTLLDDVWIEPCEAQVPPLWFSDENVRKAIRGVHMTDRCVEEVNRVQREALNMLEWFHRETLTVEVAFRNPSSEYSSPFQVHTN